MNPLDLGFVDVGDGLGGFQIMDDFPGRWWFLDLDYAAVRNRHRSILLAESTSSIGGSFFIDDMMMTGVQDFDLGYIRDQIDGAFKVPAELLQARGAAADDLTTVS